MTKPNYTEFDNVLLEQIRQGRCTAAQLDTADSGLRDLAEPFRTKTSWGCTPHYRVIDRRLQALLKGGKIEYVRGAWHIKA